MRYGSVHLDVWFDNLHIDNEKEITFLTSTFVATVTYVLTFLISYFSYFTTNLNEAEYQEKAESFLKGYETVTVIGSEEKKRFLPYACLASMVYYISVQCDRFEYWTNIFVNEDHLKGWLEI